MVGLTLLPLSLAMGYNAGLFKSVPGEENPSFARENKVGFEPFGSIKTVRFSGLKFEQFTDGFWHEPPFPHFFSP